MVEHKHIERQNMYKNQKEGNCAEDDDDKEFIEAVNLPVFEVETNDDLPKLVDNNYVLDEKKEKKSSNHVKN